VILHVSQRNARVEGRHDETGPEHVGMYDTESGSFADGPNPALKCSGERAWIVVAAESSVVVIKGLLS
jgi:hypothetical protein